MAVFVNVRELPVEPGSALHRRKWTARRRHDALIGGGCHHRIDIIGTQRAECEVGGVQDIHRIATILHPLSRLAALEQLRGAHDFVRASIPGLREEVRAMALSLWQRGLPSYLRVRLFVSSGDGLVEQPAAGTGETTKPVRRVAFRLHGRGRLAGFGRGHRAGRSGDEHERVEGAQAGGREVLDLAQGELLSALAASENYHPAGHEWPEFVRGLGGTLDNERTIVLIARPSTLAATTAITCFGERRMICANAR